MSKYQKLFDDGYFFGKIDDLGIDMDDFVKITNQIINKSESEFEANYVYTQQAENLPYSIDISEVSERKKYLENNLHIKPISSSYQMKNKDDNKHFFEYFRRMIENFIPNVFEDLNKNNIGINDSIQLYKNGDFLNPHTDNHVGNCVMIIYFSKNENYNDSGKLNMVNDGVGDFKILDSLDPVIGNYSLFELKTHNKRHEVAKVYGDFERYAYLAQIKKI